MFKHNPFKLQKGTELFPDSPSFMSVQIVSPDPQAAQREVSVNYGLISSFCRQLAQNYSLSGASQYKRSVQLTATLQMIYVNNNGDEIVTIIHRPTPAAVDEELEEILKLAAKINRRRVVWVTTGNNDGVGDIFKANEKDDLYKTFARNYPGDVVIQLLWQGTEQRLKEMQAGFAVPPASFSSSLSAVGPLLIDNPYGQAYVYTQEISFSVGIDIIIWDVKAPVSLVDDSVSYIDDAWYTIITNIVGNYSSDRLTTLCNFYLYDDYVEPIPPGQYEYDPTTGTGEGGFSNPVPPKKFNEFFNAVKSRGHEFAFPAEGDVDVSEDLYFYTVSRAEMLSRYAPYAPTFPFATEDISLPVGNIPPYKINVSAPSVKSDNFQTYFKYGNKNISSERIAEIYDPSSGFRTEQRLALDELSEKVQKYLSKKAVNAGDIDEINRNIQRGRVNKNSYEPFV